MSWKSSIISILRELKYCIWRGSVTLCSLLVEINSNLSQIHASCLLKVKLSGLKRQLYKPMVVRSCQIHLRPITQIFQIVNILILHCICYFDFICMSPPYVISIAYMGIKIWVSQLSRLKHQLHQPMVMGSSQIHLRPMTQIFQLVNIFILCCICYFDFTCMFPPYVISKHIWASKSEPIMEFCCYYSFGGVFFSSRQVNDIQIKNLQ